MADMRNYIGVDIGGTKCGTLFGEAVAEYNAQQSRPCRRIKDYLAHITEGKREEPYYEIVVQFGDSQTVPFGSERRDMAAEMLMNQIAGLPVPPEVRFSAKLVERDSVLDLKKSSI